MKTTYYFIRHAEKELGSYNPSLTEKGKKRAQHWAAILQNEGIEAIYCTPLIRTRQTAQPLADRLGLEIKIYDPSDLYNDLFRIETKGKTVLIVEHQDTTPAFVNRILRTAKYRFISGNNHANLYKVEIFPDGKVTDSLIRKDF